MKQSTAERLAGARWRASLALRRAVPDPAKPWLRAAFEAVDPLVVAAHKLRRDNGRPIPPYRLRARIGTPNIAKFNSEGEAAARTVVAIARAAGWAGSGSDAMLDFGCGCGRVLMPMAEIAGEVELAGCDIDSEAIDWLAGVHGLRADVRVNDFMPPLPFEDQRFSLVYTSSIFTHLDEETQQAWLAELERVLQPGGLALVTVHGATAFYEACKGHAPIPRSMMDRLRARGAIETSGFVFEPYHREPARSQQMPGISGAYGLAFQTKDRIAADWGERFAIVDHHDYALNGWQDVVVLRRR